MRANVWMRRDWLALIGFGDGENYSEGPKIESKREDMKGVVDS
jgi:hypothetical protein